MKEGEVGRGSPEDKTRFQKNANLKKEGGHYMEIATNTPRARFKQERQSWYDWYKKTYFKLDTEIMDLEANIKSDEQPSKRKKGKMFTYSEEERDAFEDAWFSDHDTWG